ncbi:MAG: hypothetical protein ASARMPREDX12_009489 [Alectoria sarmentosa]|nr:MAG: hypothetical protein ASARMPRED_006578 [Alectoria sarmentosa]CAD6580225.1 MAG: hypothetical protein ASARMPREDX12_009489 [Alectoria sarmentosa]
MAASMPCKDCASGVLHEGTPLGREETVHGLKTYVTGPPSGVDAKGIVVIIPGYVMDPSLLSTVHTVTDAKTPILHKIFPGLRAMTHMSCFDLQTPNLFLLLLSALFHLLAHWRRWILLGWEYVTLLCQDTERSSFGKPLLDCGFTAHPSQLVLPMDVEAVKMPLCISSGSMDFLLKPEGYEMIKEIFSRKEGELNAEGKRGAMFEMNVVDGAKHGFAIRGNPGDEDEKRRGQMAEDQAVDFFGRWLVPD